MLRVLGYDLYRTVTLSGDYGQLSHCYLVDLFIPDDGTPHEVAMVGIWYRSVLADFRRSHPFLVQSKIRLTGVTKGLLRILLL